MTVVCAYKTPSMTYLASDSLFTEGDGTRSHLECKIYPFRGGLLGMAGDWQYASVLLYQLEVADLHDDDDLLSWWSTQILSQVRDLKFDSIDFGCIFAHSSGSLVCGDLQDVTLLNDFTPTAIGSGSKYALGAMHWFSFDGDAFSALSAGVEAAKHYDVYCGGDTHFRSVAHKQ